MDLSWLKWPIIAIVIIVPILLLSDPGMNFAFNKLTAEAPGQDANKDKVNEAWLSRFGGIQLKTFRYAGAEKFFREAINRHPSGEHALYNEYRIAKCLEKQEKYTEAFNILVRLMNQNAHEHDERVPNADILRLRAEKLAETHEIAEVGTF
jgi:hypothetical protein